jgi:hypothetical protein
MLRGPGSGPALKINGLFHWKKQKSLILHEVARAAGLESCGIRSIVDTIYMGELVSSCAYLVPLENWKEETVDCLPQCEMSELHSQATWL